MLDMTRRQHYVGGVTDLVSDGPRQLRQTGKNVIWETSVWNIVLKQQDFILCIFVTDVTERTDIMTLYRMQ